MGVDAIGVIGVKGSPRFIPDSQKRNIFNILETLNPKIKRVWVVANPTLAQISESLNGRGRPSVIQLHGDETAIDCVSFKKSHPNIELWKAIRVREPKDIENAKTFESVQF